MFFFFLAAKSPLPSIIKMSSSSLVNLTVNVYFEAIVIKVKVCFEAIVALESSKAAEQLSSRAAKQQSSKSKSIATESKSILCG